MKQKGFPYFVPPDVNGNEQDPMAYVYQRMLEMEHRIDDLVLKLSLWEQRYGKTFNTEREFPDSPFTKVHTAQAVTDDGKIVELGSRPKPVVIPPTPLMPVKDYIAAIKGDVVAPKIEVVQDTPLIINQQWRDALDDLNNGTEHLFVTGEAGCLSGDTIVEINRGGCGRKPTLKHLHHMLCGGISGGKRFDLTIPTKIRSLTQDDIVGQGVVAQSIYSGKKTTFTVSTFDGQSVRATAEHRFLTAKGWRQLRDLSVGDLLIVDGGKPKATKRPKKENYLYYRDMFNHPYHAKRGTKAGGRVVNSVPVHRIVFEASILNEMEIDEYLMWIRAGYANGLEFVNPKTHVVHHKDSNTKNNALNNLELMTIREHGIRHAQQGTWKHFQARVKASPITSIVEYGLEDTYDLTIADGMNPNFLANGIVVHNSGKSTMLNHWMGQTNRNVVVTAPTGVAALRVNGETLHRFFHFPTHALDEDDVPGLSEKDILKIKHLDTLVIDEISMVRADLMDAIERTLRKYGPERDRAFGGVRIVMVGDPFQLPPVVADKEKGKPLETFLEAHYGTTLPFFFHAHCWEKKMPKIVELTEIFRQSDPAFVSALNAIRRGNLTPEYLATINARVDRAYRPSADEMMIRLVTTNAKAQEANQVMIEQLPGEAEIFVADIRDDFGKDYPTEERLALKPGAAIMFIRNDNKNHLYVNGTLAKVLEVKPFLLVEVNGVERIITREKWESVSYEFDPKAKKLKKTVKGTFEQIPVKVAAAITIHKSQGLTLKRVMVDLGWGTFAPGQAYVSLSRAETLEGMVLTRPLKQEDLLVSKEVQRFMNGESIARPQ